MPAGPITGAISNPQMVTIQGATALSQASAYVLQCTTCTASSTAFLSFGPGAWGITIMGFTLTNSHPGMGHALLANSASSPGYVTAIALNVTGFDTAFSSSYPSALFMVDGCTAIGNNVGASAYFGGTVYVGLVTIVGNNIGTSYGLVASIGAHIYPIQCSVSNVAYGVSCDSTSSVPGYPSFGSGVGVQYSCVNH